MKRTADSVPLVYGLSKPRGDLSLARTNFIALSFIFFEFWNILMYHVRKMFGSRTSNQIFAGFKRTNLKQRKIISAAHLQQQRTGTSWFSLSSYLPAALKPKMQSQFQLQNFDYFLVLDFEATCDTPKQPYPMEIIEFPVLKVSAKTFEVEDRFHRYVRPTINPVLSTFCIELTGILQEMVDESDKFHRVYNDFQQWLRQTQLIDEWQRPIERFTFATCGDWDLRKIFPLQCHICGHEVPRYMRQWINVKKSFVEQCRHWPKSQAYLIEYFGIEATGRAHSGIDDCHNLVTIMREIAKLGHVFQNTSNIKDR